MGLDTTLAAPLLAYLAELQKWNRAYSLTAVRDPAQMVTRHILDSLSVLRYLPATRPHPNPPPQAGEGELIRPPQSEHGFLPPLAGEGQDGGVRQPAVKEEFLPPLAGEGQDGGILDVGSGAGLPGIPLAIARPELAVTVLDSNGKKARFLRHVQRTLNLRNLAVVEERAEHHRPPEPYGIVVSRAFAGLGEFLQTTAHLGAPDGQWLAMKGKLGAAELKDLPPGFRIMEIKALHVPGLSEQRNLVIVSRVPS